MELMLLPIDIVTYRDYTDKLSFPICNVEYLIDSYLDDDRDSSDNYHEDYVNYDNSDTEIDYIFNRE